MNMPSRLFRYLAEPGKSEAHIVLPGSTREEIVTTSIFHCGEGNGHTWLGTEDEFKKQFRRIN